MQDGDDLYCDSCGELIDIDDEANSEFALVDTDSDEMLCPFCNSDVAE